MSEQELEKTCIHVGERVIELRRKIDEEKGFLGVCVLFFTGIIIAAFVTLPLPGFLVAAGVALVVLYSISHDSFKKIYDLKLKLRLYLRVYDELCVPREEESSRG